MECIDLLFVMNSNYEVQCAQISDNSFPYAFIYSFSYASMANALILFSTHRLQSVLVGTSINVALSSILNTDSLE